MPQGHLRRDLDLDLDTWLEGDGSNLLDDLTRGVEVDEALVDLQLIPVPGLGTLTTRSFTGGDLQDLGGETNRALDTELLVFGTADEISRELLEVLDGGGSQCDPDLVDFGGGYGASGVVFFFSFRDVGHLVDR
jgi:hypothetical protein